MNNFSQVTIRDLFSGRNRGRIYTNPLQKRLLIIRVQIKNGVKEYG